MAIKINNNSYNKFYLDGDEVSKIYLNSSLVYIASSGGDEPVWDEWEEDFLTFTALEATDITLSPNQTGTTYPTVYYKKQGDNAYTQMTSSTTISLNSDEKVKFYGSNTSINKTTSRYVRFTSTGRFEASGKVTSLLSSGGTDPTTETKYRYAFACLFRDCTKLVSAKNLVLPGVIPERGCAYMFDGCTNLETAPALPATTLSSSCYSNMFRDCTSLTTAPALPATTLSSNCYSNMFDGCTNLETAPALPATTLSSSCYSNMFRDCTSLTTAPALPATTLSSSCYNFMFRDCTSLTTAPELPASAATSACYAEMFEDCTSLVNVPVINIVSAATYTYRNMFNGCSKLASVSIKTTALANTHAFSNWLGSTASSGTVYAPANRTYTDSSLNLPSGWSVQNLPT